MPTTTPKPKPVPGVAPGQAASKHCTCACCSHKVIAMNAAWCGNPGHPNPPQSLREILAPKTCNYWSPEMDFPGPMPEWLMDALRQHDLI